MRNERAGWSKRGNTPILTKRHVAIVEGRLAGKTMRTIAEELGDITVSGVSNALWRPPVKALLEEMRSRVIAESLPNAVDNVCAVIQDYQSPIVPDSEGKVNAADLQRKEHGINASFKVMEGAGLLKSNKPSIYINPSNNDVTIYPHITRMLQIELRELTESSE